MLILVQRHADHTVVRLRGELDAASRSRILQEIEEVSGSGTCRLVLNIQNLRFIDSTGFDEIIRVSRGLAAKGGKVAISSPYRLLPDRHGDDGSRSDPPHPRFG